MSTQHHKQKYLTRKFFQYRRRPRPQPAPVIPPRLLTEAIVTGASALKLLAGGPLSAETFPTAPHLEKLSTILWAHYLTIELAARKKWGRL